MFDGCEVIILNVKIGGDVIINFNCCGMCCFEFIVGIGYKDDIGVVMVEIEKLFEVDLCILKDLVLGVWIFLLGESLVDLVICGWICIDDLWVM